MVLRAISRRPVNQETIPQEVKPCCIQVFVTYDGLEGENQLDSYIFDLMETHDYENIFFCQEKTLGLKAIIAIHDTTLGPAAGGIRMWPYESEADAIKDVLRLARGMTYKCAAAGASYGGGKCVVIGDPKHDKETPYVVTVPEAWGGPSDGSQATAYGVVQGIRSCLKEVYGSPDLQGRTIALQGIGAVGTHTLKYLVEAGAIVTISDIDQERTRLVAAKYNTSIASTEEIHSLRVDVYCPCALGNVLNDQTIPELRCKIVCGSANNQLGDNLHGDLLHARGILYTPDYIVNAGGLLSNLDSLNPGGFNHQRAMEQVSRLYNSIENIIAISKEQNIPTYRAADILAEQRIASIRQLKSLASGNEKSREK